MASSTSSAGDRMPAASAAPHVGESSTTAPHRNSLASRKQSKHVEFQIQFPRRPVIRIRRPEIFSLECNSSTSSRRPWKFTMKRALVRFAHAVSWIVSTFAFRIAVPILIVLCQFFSIPKSTIGLQRTSASRIIFFSGAKIKVVRSSRVRRAKTSFFISNHVNLSIPSQL